MFNEDSHFKPVCTDEYMLRKTNWQKEKNEAKTTPSQKTWSCCGSNGFLLSSASSYVRALCNFSLQALLIYPFKLTFWFITKPLRNRWKIITITNTNISSITNTYILCCRLQNQSQRKPTLLGRDRVHIFILLTTCNNA